MRGRLQRENTHNLNQQLAHERHRNEQLQKDLRDAKAQRVELQAESERLDQAEAGKQAQMDAKHKVQRILAVTAKRSRAKTVQVKDLTSQLRVLRGELTSKSAEWAKDLAQRDQLILEK